MFVILWEFEVKSGSESEFKREYGSEGAWATFFRRDPAYRGTRLARDTGRSGRYYTLDFWVSRAAYESFRKRNAAEYKRIDARCEVMTARETRLGEFESNEERFSAPKARAEGQRSSLRSK